MWRLVKQVLMKKNNTNYTRGSRYLIDYYANHPKPKTRGFAPYLETLFDKLNRHSRLPWLESHLRQPDGTVDYVLPSMWNNNNAESCNRYVCKWLGSKS